MNLAVFPVFMFQLVIRTFCVLSNVFASLRTVLLSSELAALMGHFQRPSDGKG